MEIKKSELITEISVKKFQDGFYSSDSSINRRECYNCQSAKHSLLFIQ